MPFEPGKEKTGGRKPGTPNKETKRVREWVGKFLANNIDRFEEDVNELSAKDRTRVILDLMEYSVPKLQRTELVGEEDNAVRLVIMRDTKGE